MRTTVDHYATLGLEPGATAEQIGRAYRTLARELHPDTHPGDPAAEERFRAVSEAYAVLSRPDRRQAYDRQRRAVRAGGRPGAGSGRRVQVRVQRPGRDGADARTALRLDLAEALRGTTRTVRAPGSAEPVRVRIPAGVRDGARVRLRGRGHPGSAGGRPGDLYVDVSITPDDQVQRRGDDLHATVGISVADAALGTTVVLPVLDEHVAVAVPAGTQPGAEVRVPGAGAPRVHGGRGDLVVTVAVLVPTELTDEQRSLLEALQDTMPRP